MRPLIAVALVLGSVAALVGCGSSGGLKHPADVMRSFSAAGIRLAVLVDSRKTTKQEILRMTAARKGDPRFGRRSQLNTRKQLEWVLAKGASHPVVLLTAVQQPGAVQSSVGIAVYVWGHESDAVDSEARVLREKGVAPEPHVTRIRNVVVIYFLDRNEARTVKALALLR
jgi:hypothetical protein